MVATCEMASLVRGTMGIIPAPLAGHGSREDDPASPRQGAGLAPLPSPPRRGMLWG